MENASCHDGCCDIESQEISNMGIIDKVIIAGHRA